MKRQIALWCWHLIHPCKLWQHGSPSFMTNVTDFCDLWHLWHDSYNCTSKFDDQTQPGYGVTCDSITLWYETKMVCYQIEHLLHIQSGHMMSPGVSCGVWLKRASSWGMILRWSGEMILRWSWQMILLVILRDDPGREILISCDRPVSRYSPRCACNISDRVKSPSVGSPSRYSKW